MTLDPAKLKALGLEYAQAWSSGSAVEVASYFAPDAKMIINNGEPLNGRAAIVAMANQFYAEFPGMIVRCDGMRTAGSHAIFLWTLEGRHAKTGNDIEVGGWEEWEFGDDMKIKSSLGWFDAVEYNRQIADGL